MAPLKNRTSDTRKLPMATNPDAIYVVPTLGWKREGRNTYQRSRIELVRRLDTLLEQLERDRHLRCTADGHVIPVEDYLAVRPEQTERLQRLAEEGRLVIGPWYTQPDPFLVTQEGLVRNLLAGRAFTAALGAQTSEAYMGFTSGLGDQLPQILAGFGIGCVITPAGAGDRESGLWWKGLDGTRILLIHARPEALVKYLPSGVKDQQAHLSSVREALESRSRSGELLLVLDGDPALQANSVLENLVPKRRRTKRVEPQVSGFADLAKFFHDTDSLKSLSGELMSPALSPLRPGSRSARMPLKLRQFAVETLLTGWVEPFGTWSILTNAANNHQVMASGYQALTREAWRLVLQNHGQTSVGGLASDSVAREVRTRYEQAEQIAQQLTDDSLAQIASQIPCEKKAVSVAVFNGTGIEQSAVTEITLHDMGLPTNPAISDEQGEVHPCESIRDRAGTTTLRFAARDIPAFGYRTFSVVEGEGWEHQPHEDPYTIENEWVSISIDRELGSLDLYDKRTARSFHDLNHYVDGGDAGDLGWYTAPERDTVIDVPTNAPLHVERIVTPVEQILHFLQIYRLPDRLTPDRKARLQLTAQFVPISVVTTVRIARGIPRVDVSCLISNAAQDHRLSVLFPTGIEANRAWFDSHYGVTKRELALPSGRKVQQWAEPPTPERPQRAFVTVMGDETGLTIANRGLPEVAVHQTSQGAVIALTLLRSVGWLDARSQDETPLAVPEAQCLGELDVEYSIIPHTDDLLSAWRMAWAFQNAPRTLRLTPGAGGLPRADSLATSDHPAFILTSVRMGGSGEAVIVRGFNVTDDEIETRLQLGFRVKDAEFALLDETPTDSRPERLSAQELAFAVGPHQIVTLRITPD